ALDREDERKPEALGVGAVERVEALVLGRGEAVEAGALLLAARIGGEVAGDGGLAGEVRMAAQQGELLRLAGLGDHREQGAVEIVAAVERPAGGSATRDPGRVLEDMRE